MRVLAYVGLVGSDWWHDIRARLPVRQCSRPLGLYIIEDSISCITEDSISSGTASPACSCAGLDFFERLQLLFVARLRPPLARG